MPVHALETMDVVPQTHRMIHSTIPGSYHTYNNTPTHVTWQQPPPPPGRETGGYKVLNKPLPPLSRINFDGTPAPTPPPPCPSAPARVNHYPR